MLLRTMTRTILLRRAMNDGRDSMTMVDTVIYLEVRYYKSVMSCSN